VRDAVDLFDHLDLVISRGPGVIPDDTLNGAAQAVRQMRARRGYHGDTLVLGLIGGTGAGKSSLLNAIAGEPVASTSHIRPHTDRPLAWVPDGISNGLTEILDTAGIEDRRVQSSLPDVALLDLPDVDSVVADHRGLVESLLPIVDGFLWLFDPEKYRDPAIHRDFLAPLARYRDQFTFVMNKVDLVAPDHLESLVVDLRDALGEDGYPQPVIYPVAAAPPRGDTIGIEMVREHLETRLDAKKIVMSKVVGDARTVLRYLADAAEVWNGAAIDFEARWDRDRDASAGVLALSSAPGGREDALCRIEDFIAIVAAEVGAVCGDEVRDRFTTDALEDTVRAAAEAATGARAIRKARPRSGSSADASHAAAAVLEEEVGGPLRTLLWRRAWFGATVTTAIVGVSQLESGNRPDQADGAVSGEPGL
jgi:GTPase SAR1 family protein